VLPRKGFFQRSGSAASCSCSARSGRSAAKGLSSLKRRDLVLTGLVYRLQAAVDPADAATDDQVPSDGEVVPLDTTFKPAGPNERFGNMNAMVFGATGKTGKEIVSKLQREGVPCSVFARSPKKANDLFQSEIEQEGVKVYEGDVSRYEDVAKAVEESDSNVIMVAIGTRAALDPLGPFSVDYNGTCNIVAAAKKKGTIKHIVLVTSIGVDDILFPLNLFWGVLFWKKRSEEVLQRSSIQYTIVRPGGLTDEPRAGSLPGAIRMDGPDAYGLPPRKSPGSILRSQVAQVAVSALVEEAAFNKTVEIVAEENQSDIPIPQLFQSI